jgi:cubilin
VSPSKRIQLVFAALQIEVHPNCSYDYLEVRDGLEDTGPLLGMFCNTTLPPPLVSSGPYLSLRFHSDGSSTDMGFHVTFAEVPGIPGCGGVFTESQGVISSPQHPEPYAHGMDCEYLIRLPASDERIVLTFLQFELESGPNCRYDHVEVQ